MAYNVDTSLIFTILLTLPALTGSVNTQSIIDNDDSDLSSRSVSETSENSLSSESSVTTLFPLNDVSLDRDCFTWDKANATARDYQNSYCPARCSGKTKLNLAPFEGCLADIEECFPCSCDRPLCETYGTCCPSLHHQDTQSETNGFQTGDTATKCDEHTLTSETFLYIRSCPKGFPDQHVLSMCVDDVPTDELTIESFSRAHDDVTEVVYYNKYCAHCNNVSQPMVWEVSIGCEHYHHVYTATSKEELLRLSLKNDSECKVHQLLPDGRTFQPCQSGWFGEVISSCNATGEWSAPDDDVSSQCESDQDQHNVKERVFDSSSGKYYRNIFCALCNPDSSHTERCHTVRTCHLPSPSPPEYPYILPFSLLLGSFFNKRDKETTETERKYRKCPVLEWLSPDNKCINVSCTEGKIVNNRTCGTAMTFIAGLPYTFHISYILKTIPEAGQLQGVSNIHQNWSHFLNDFVWHFEKLMLVNPIIAEAEIEITYVRQNRNSSVVNGCPLSMDSCEDLLMDTQSIAYQPSIEKAEFLLQVKAYLVAGEYISRDEFENEMITSLHFNFSEEQEEHHSGTQFVPMFVPDIKDVSICFAKHFPRQDQLEDGQVLILRRTSASQKMLRRFNQTFLNLSPVLICAHICFSQPEFTVSVNCSTFPPTWQISLYLGHVTLIFSDVTDLNRLTVLEEPGGKGVQLKVCIDLLEEKIQEMNTRPKLLELEESAVYLSQYYLTQVCIGLSMICLFLTLLTFALFPPLRNNAGTNNMFLSGTILLAQASLLSSVHVDGPSWLCTTLGISTHFLWLSVTYWSFICCLHMFRVFASKTGVTQSSAASQKISLIKKVLASILTPTVVIATVMTSSYLKSGGQRIGYTDRNPCYLDSSLVTLLSLVAPLGVVCVVNCCFFAYTIYKIHQITMLQAHLIVKKSDRDTFTVYIKLSTMTGSFWIVAIVSEIVDSTPLRFAAIILNGFQGVFLFLSFVCNKRVMRSCFRAMLKQKHNSGVTDSSKTS